MTQRSDDAPQALAGLRVLDLSRVLAGPWATQMLGDLGAEVVKVENPARRDDTRGWGPPFLEDTAEVWDAAYYFCANRNKQAVAVDFARPEGAAIIRRLAGAADVVVENFKVGTLARHGLDYPSLRKLNPRLIYCSITGFGQDGPYAGRGGYDFLVQGMSGLMSVTGRPDGEPGGGPLKVGLPVSDLFCGLYAGVSILAALNHRHATGEGQYIDCALLDCQVALLANQGMNFLIGNDVPRRLGNGHPNVVPYADFPTADGAILITCGNDGQFRALCRLLGRDDLLADERYRSNAGRLRHRVDLEGALRRSTAAWQARDLLAALEGAGIPGGPVNTLDQVFADPQVQARNMLRTVSRVDGTPVPILAYPAKFSRTPPSYRIAPPRFGQDTQALLTDRLELGPDEMRRLIDDGVVGVDRAAEASPDAAVRTPPSPARKA